MKKKQIKITCALSRCLILSEFIWPQALLLCTTALPETSSCCAALWQNPSPTGKLSPQCLCVGTLLPWVKFSSIHSLFSCIRIHTKASSALHLIFHVVPPHSLAPFYSNPAQIHFHCALQMQSLDIMNSLTAVEVTVELSVLFKMSGFSVTQLVI